MICLASANQGVRLAKLTRANQIWILKPQEEDLIKGAKYAAISMPWTFNRMGANTRSRGQCDRAMRIAKGIVAQEVLRRELINRGIKCPTQEKSHRDTDLFDFHIEINGSESKLDLKTINYYSDYRGTGRERLSPELIIKYAAYSGPRWHTFFPMPVPHSQIDQSKEAYCFAISESADFRRNPLGNRSRNVLAAFPTGDWYAFFTSSKLCALREEARKGFYLRIKYTGTTLLSKPQITLRCIGEWEKKTNVFTIALSNNREERRVGPFSCLASFQIPTEIYNELEGHVEISVDKNEFVKEIFNTTGRDVNTAPSGALVLHKTDFCNLILPRDYKLYFIGWIPKETFLKECRKYPAWIWPVNAENPKENTPWTQITESDATHIERAGFSDCIQDKPRRFNAGWLKTTGIGNGGACCYVFPNIGGGRGGFLETNLYVLPQDLYRMDSLGT